MKNYCSFGWRVLQRNTPTTLPFKLTYVVTKECHSKCTHCSIWQERPKNELTLDEIRLFAANSSFLRWIDFTGGEPTDRDDFGDLVDAFVRNCPQLLFIHFPTNGLKPDRVLRAATEILDRRSPRLVITVSIDGPEEVNDRLRGIPGDFQRAVETFEKLSVLKGAQTFIGMTLNNDNSHVVLETIRALKQACPHFSPDKFHLNLAHSSEHYYGKVNPSRNSTVETAWKESLANQRFARTPFEILERIFQKQAVRYLIDGATPISCGALASSCYLSETGTVYPCTIWNAPLGNIRDSNYSLVPILRSARAAETREKVCRKDCPNCWTPCEAYPSILSNIVEAIR